MDAGKREYRAIKEVFYEWMNAYWLDQMHFGSVSMKDYYDSFIPVRAAEHVNETLLKSKHNLRPIRSDSPDWEYPIWLQISNQ